MTRLYRLVLFVVVLVIASACRQQVLSVESIHMDVTVTDLLVGETTLIITVTDNDGNPIENPGRINIRGDMDHAGMIPILHETSDSTNGVYTIPYEWTMGGAWTLEVKLTLNNGEVATETFDYEILTEASEDDMADMSGMDEMESRGETSAVYMQITNHGEETVTITGASVDVAGITEIHETIVENDVARMRPVEMLVIESGETVELRPGGKHIMLMQLTQDVVVGNDISVSLNLESGDVVTVDAIVQDMMMDDVDNTVEIDNLTISNIWARPASAGMPMDMDATEEADSGD